MCLLLLPGMLPAQQVLQYPEKDRGASRLSVPYDTGRIRDMLQSAASVRTAFPDSAIRILRQAARQSAAAGYANGLVRALIALSNTYVHTGAYNQALEILQEAVPQSMGAGQQRYLPTLYNNQASLYRTLGDYEQAARCYYQAILLSEKFAPAMSRGLIYSNLSTVLLQLGRVDQALYYLDKAEAVSRHEKNFELAASVLIHKGVFYVEQRDWEKGRLYFQTALEMGRRQTAPALREIAVELCHTALVNLGQYYQLREQPVLALPYLKEAVALNDKVNAYHRNTALTVLGQVYYRLKDYRHAEYYLTAARREAASLFLTNDLIQSYRTLAELYAATGRTAEAFATQQQYMTLKDSVESREVISSIARLEARYRVAEKDKALIQSQLRIARQEKNLERQKSWMLGIAAGALISVILLIGVYRNNRHKQRLQAEKILNLQQEQEIGKLKAMMQGEEQERARIARELHDGIGGMLAAVNINLGTLQQQHRTLAGIEDLDRIAAMLRETAAEVRKSAHNLIPDNLVKYGLTETLRLYCDQVNAGRLVQIDLQCYGPLDSMEQSLTLTIYRMLQEFIQNIVRHAKASHASVQLRLQEHELCIVIEDNGKGFDHDTRDAGMGLKNVYERVQALQGHISIESVKGNGTIAFVELDLRRFNAANIPV